MKQLVYILNRHLKEHKEIEKCYQEQKPVSNVTLKKMELTSVYDFRPNAIKQALQCDKNYEVKIGDEKGSFLFLYMLNDNNIPIAYQIYGLALTEGWDFFPKGYCNIMFIETQEKYRGQGIASQLLDTAEKILLEDIGFNTLCSSATKYSRDIFRKRGYTIVQYSPQVLQFASNKDVTSCIVFTKEDYKKRKIDNALPPQTDEQERG